MGVVVDGAWLAETVGVGVGTGGPAGRWGVAGAGNSDVGGGCAVIEGSVGFGIVLRRSTHDRNYLVSKAEERRELAERDGT